MPLKTSNINIALLVISIFAGFAFAKDDGKKITRSEAIAIALDAMKMTPKELTLQGKVDVDSFRLAIVDQMMARPTMVPDLLDSLIKHLDFTTGTTFLTASASILDLQPATPIFNEHKENFPWADKTEIPPSVKKALDLLFGSFMDAQIELNAAFSQLDSFQLDSLLKRAPDYLMPDDEKLEGEVDEATLEEEDLRQIEEERADARFFTLAQRVNQQKLISSAQRVTQSAWAAKDMILNIKPQSGTAEAPDTIAFGDIIYYAETEFGSIIIGGAGPTIYLQPCAIIIDLGGDDEYRGGAGGTDTTLKFSVSIDIKGKDVYWSDNSFAIAAGLGGIGVLIDMKGDDHYRSLNHSQGMGAFGWGILWDYEGDDIYAGHTAVQGAGFCGGGLLYDAGGNDRYEAHLYSQAFGFVGGLGVIWDVDGNDSYACTGASVDKIRYADHHVTLSQGFGYGYRPDYSGGVGLLVECSGNDSYVSDIFGQGASYWFALGAIYDMGGNDNYSSYQYAQGAGVHLSSAGLVDFNGNDSYVSHGVSQGCGHDLAIGFLDDRAGDDNYVTWDLAQGAGNANGIGILVDEGEGEDSYVAKREYNIQGYGNWRRDFGSIGMMLDLGGEDAYSGKGTEGKWWSFSNYGIGIDFPAGVPPQANKNGNNK